jgi:hypothetical protein
MCAVKNTARVHFTRRSQKSFNSPYKLGLLVVKILHCKGGYLCLLLFTDVIAGPQRLCLLLWFTALFVIRHFLDDVK